MRYPPHTPAVRTAELGSPVCRYLTIKLQPWDSLHIVRIAAISEQLWPWRPQADASREKGKTSLERNNSNASWFNLKVTSPAHVGVVRIPVDTDLIITVALGAGGPLSRPRDTSDVQPPVQSQHSNVNRGRLVHQGKKGATRIFGSKRDGAIGKGIAEP
jgi:hypothetical protein